MGFGDEIMASGHARIEATRIEGRVHILDKSGNPRWHGLWEGLPWIARPKERAKGAIHNASYCRPYIKYPFTREGGCEYSGWRARDHLGSICLSENEVSWAKDVLGYLGSFVIVEPEIAPMSNPNKQWGMLKWGGLIDLLYKRIPVVQLLPPGQGAFDKAIGVSCPSFRHAAAAISMCQIALLPEGGLHHAAAALGKKVVVLFGGCISPKHTGYPFHINVFDTGPDSPCGKWVPCAHCDKIWADLSPESVYRAALV